MTQLYLTKTNKNSPYAEITLNGSFPLYCSYTEKGCVNLVCDNKIVSYDSYGKQVSEYIISDGYKLLAVDVNRYGCVAVISKGNEKSVIMFDRNGKITYNNMLDKSVESISVYGKYIFILSTDNIIRIDSQSGKTVSAEKGINSRARMLVRDENEIYLCMDSRIKYIKID